MSWDISSWLIVSVIVGPVSTDSISKPREISLYMVSGIWEQSITIDGIKCSVWNILVAWIDRHLKQAWDHNSQDIMIVKTDMNINSTVNNSLSQKFEDFFFLSSTFSLKMKQKQSRIKRLGNNHSLQSELHNKLCLVNWIYDSVELQKLGCLNNLN